MSTTMDPLADYDQPEDGPAEEIGSDAWLRSRSAAELKQIVERGLLAGDMFYSASREIERRVREENQRKREAQEAQKRRSKKRGRKLDAVTIAAIVLLFVLLALAVLFNI